MGSTRRSLLAVIVAVGVLVSGSGIAFAAMSSTEGLVSTSHPDDAIWYSDDSPVFEWDSPFEPASFGLSGAGSVAVQGDLLATGIWEGYGAVDDSIVFYDMADPDSPVQLDLVSTVGRPQGLAFDGDYLVVAEDSAGLSVWDISDPTDVTLADSIGGPGEAVDVKVAGAVAYVADYDGYIWSFDISDPTDLVALDSYALTGSPNGLDIHGNMALVACRWGGVRAVSIVDPANMGGLVALAGGDPQDVAVAGDVAYVAMHAEGVRSLDISDPSTITVLDTLDYDGMAWDVEVEGDVVYTTLDSADGGAIQLISAADPADLEALPSFAVGGYSYDVAVEGARAYAACLLDGLYQAQVAEPWRTPYGVGGVNLATDVECMEASGDTLWVGTSGSGGIFACDISDIHDSSPSTSKVATYTASQDVTDLDIEGDVLYYVDTATNTLVSLDVSDRTAPGLMGTSSDPSDPYALEVRGDTAFVADGADGLRTLDVSLPVSPAPLDSFDTTGTAYDVDVQGRVAYVADGDEGLVCLDVSKRADIDYLGSLDTTDSALSVAVQGDVAYVAYDTLGLQCIDITDPTDPTLLGGYNPGGSFTAVKVLGDLCLLGNGEDGARVVDISDPADPTLVSTYASLGGGGASGNTVMFHGAVGYVGTDTTNLVRGFVTRFAPIGWSVRLNADIAVKPDSSVDTIETSWPESGIADGTWYLGVQSQPLYGPNGGWRDVGVKIDTTAPTTTDNAGSVYTGPASIALSATDPTPGSGIDATYYQLNGGEAQVYGSSVSATRPRTYTLKYWSEDVAGNVESKSSAAFAVHSDGTTPHAIEGANRYVTAVEVSQESFPDGADTVVIATGRNWPDALGGAALAGAYDAPILLVDTNSVPAVVAEEIARLEATDAIILGGIGAVSDAVKTALEGEDLTVERIGGANRYETAQMVAAAAIEKLDAGDGYMGKAFVATGANFPDALAGSPLSAGMGWPIYLVSKTGSPPTGVMKSAGVSSVLVLGGEGAVSAAQATELVGAFGGDNVDRLAGANRYATGVEVAKYGVDEAGLLWDSLAIATGQNFPDALAGGVLPATNGSVMLLTATSSLPGVVADALQENRDWIADVYYLGGVGAVTQDVRDAVEGVLK